MSSLLFCRCPVGEMRERRSWKLPLQIRTRTGLFDPLPLHRLGHYDSRMKDFRELEIWRRSRAISVSVYRITEDIPALERYGLIQQAGSAAISVSANIAEGCGRFGSREFARFLSIALGSEAELESHIELSAAFGFVEQKAADSLLADCQELRGMLVTMARRLSSRQ